MFPGESGSRRVGGFRGGSQGLFGRPVCSFAAGVATGGVPDVRRISSCWAISVLQARAWSEGVERFGEVAQQDAERFLIEYRWARQACGRFEGWCVAERTGVDRCGLDQVGTCPVLCVRNQAGHVLLDGRQDEVLDQDEAARSECGGEKNDATGMNRSFAWVHVWAFGRPGRQLVGLWMRRQRRMRSRIDVFMSDVGLWRREVVLPGGSFGFVMARIAGESASEERGRLPDTSHKSI